VVKNIVNIFFKVLLINFLLLVLGLLLEGALFPMLYLLFIYIVLLGTSLGLTLSIWVITFLLSYVIENSKIRDVISIIVLMLIFMSYYFIVDSNLSLSKGNSQEPRIILRELGFPIAYSISLIIAVLIGFIKFPVRKR
jgi:hypothetical protein